MSRSAARTSKNTVMLLTGTMVRMVGNFAFVMFSASQLGLVGFGKYSLGMFYFELFVGLSATAVGILLTRDIARWPRHISELLTSAMALTAVIAIAASAIMLSLGVFLNYSPDTVQAINIAALALLPAAIGVILEATLVALERAEYVTLAVSAESILRVAASIAALWAGYGLVSLFWILIVSRGLQLLMFGICICRIVNLNVSFRWQRTKRFAAQWRIFAAENWMAAIYTSLDVFVLSWWVGEAAVGLYSAAWKIVRLGSVVAKAYTTAVFPVLSRLYQRSRRDFEKLNMDTIRLMCAIALPAVLVITVLSARIIGVVYYSGEYTDAIPVLQILIWVLLLEFLNPFLSHTLFARGRQDKSMLVAAIALMVNSVATLILVSRFGAFGAALGTIMGGLVATCSYMYFALSKAEIKGVIGSAARALAAGLILGLVLTFFRDSSWLIIGVVTLPLYVALVWCFQVVNTNDVDLLKSILFPRTATQQ